MTEHNDVEASLQRALSTVATNTQATNRWSDVVARIENPGMAQGDLDYVTVLSPPRRRHSSRPLAAIVAFVAVLAGAFGLASLAGSDGAGSPEAAVQDLFDAIADEDPIGVLQTIAPSEREVLVPVLERLAGELDRLEVASDDLDLRDLHGADVEFGELQMTTTNLSEDYAMVEVDDTAVQADLELGDLPFAEALRGAVLPYADDPEAATTEASDLKLVTVHEDGGWHLGLQATLARFAQDEDGVPAPDFAGGGIPARGAASPEAAAREMYEAIYEHDYRRMIELTPVAESAALHAWGPSLVAAADDGESEPVVQVQSLEFAVEDGDGGVKLMRPSSYRTTATDDEGSSELSYDGRCITGRRTGDGGSDEQVVCGPFTADPFSSALSSVYTIIGWGVPRTLAVVEEDGEWFVSPGRSIAAVVFEDLAPLDPEAAIRKVRAAYFGSEWADAPTELWEACGVARPAADAPDRDGEAAYERCGERLPEDYDGPYSSAGPSYVFGFPFSFSESGVIEESEAGSTSAIPTETTVLAPTTTGP